MNVSTHNHAQPVASSHVCSERRYACRGQKSLENRTNLAAGCSCAVLKVNDVNSLQIVPPSTGHQPTPVTMPCSWPDDDHHSPIDLVIPQSVIIKPQLSSAKYLPSMIFIMQLPRVFSILGFLCWGYHIARARLIPWITEAQNKLGIGASSFVILIKTIGCLILEVVAQAVTDLHVEKSLEARSYADTHTKEQFVFGSNLELAFLRSEIQIMKQNNVDLLKYIACLAALFQLVMLLNTNGESSNLSNELEICEDNVSVPENNQAVNEARQSGIENKDPGGDMDSLQKIISRGEEPHPRINSSKSSAVESGPSDTNKLSMVYDQEVKNKKDLQASALLDENPISKTATHGVSSEVSGDAKEPLVVHGLTKEDASGIHASGLTNEKSHSSSAIHGSPAEISAPEDATEPLMSHDPKAVKSNDLHASGLTNEESPFSTGNHGFSDEISAPVNATEPSMAHNLKDEGPNDLRAPASANMRAVQMPATPTLPAGGSEPSNKSEPSMPIPGSHQAVDQTCQAKRFNPNCNKTNDLPGLTSPNKGVVPTKTTSKSPAKASGLPDPTKPSSSNHEATNGVAGCNEPGSTRAEPTSNEAASPSNPSVTSPGKEDDTEPAPDSRIIKTKASKNKPARSKKLRSGKKGKNDKLKRVPRPKHPRNKPVSSPARQDDVDMNDEVQSNLGPATQVQVLPSNLPAISAANQKDAEMKDDGQITVGSNPQGAPFTNPSTSSTANDCEIEMVDESDTEMSDGDNASDDTVMPDAQRNFIIPEPEDTWMWLWQEADAPRTVVSLRKLPPLSYQLTSVAMCSKEFFPS